MKRAAGVRFEEMGVILPRPDDYAPLFTDLMARLGIPHRLHPSLPLRFGRAARSLLLLLRCRGLERSAVMEFLTFAPVPWEGLLPEGEPPRPAAWDQITRDAQIVSGFGSLPHRTPALRQAGARGRRSRTRRNPTGPASHARFGRRHLAGRGRGPERDPRNARRRGQLVRLVGPSAGGGRALDPRRARPGGGPGRARGSAGLATISPRAEWAEVESVLEARLEWERVPLDPVRSGAVHVGALEAMAGLTFRVVAIPGLVEGGYPGAPRPDPFLLDGERAALRTAPAPRAPAVLAR